MKIIEDVITDKIVEQYKELNIISKNNSKNYIGQKTIQIIDDEQIVSVCIFLTEYKFEEIFRDTFDCLYDYCVNEYKIQRDKLQPILNNCIYLDWIISIQGKRGYSTHIINYLKEKYQNIWLYSLIDAEEFWVKQGFKDLGDHNFLYINE